MAITVGDIYVQFPNFRPEDMIKLCNGNENLNGRTVVPLANIAAFNDNNLSIFAAEREGKNYTNLLPKNARTQINQEAGIVDNTPDKKPGGKSAASTGNPYGYKYFCNKIRKHI